MDILNSTAPAEDGKEHSTSWDEFFKNHTPKFTSLMTLRADEKDPQKILAVELLNAERIVSREVVEEGILRWPTKEFKAEVSRRLEERYPSYEDQLTEAIKAFPHGTAEQGSPHTRNQTK